MLIKSEICERITKMQLKLKEQELDGALFIYPIDVYYFTGTRQNASLWIPTDGEPLLLVRKSFARAKEESPLEDIRQFPSSKEFSSVIPVSATKIGMTFDVTPVQQLHFYTKLLPGRNFIDITAPYRSIRSVKSAYELEQLQQSAITLCSIFEQVPQFLSLGMTELELAADFELRLRKAGSEGYIRMRAFNQELFQGLAVSGGGATYGFFDGAVTGKGLSNAAPHGSSGDILHENAPILIDYTGVYNGYITDMTRIFVVGQLEDDLQRAFEVSLEIQNHLQKALKPGAVCEELFHQTLAIAESSDFGPNFMGMPGEQAKFVGHGVGLELDELPIIAQGFKMPLQVGNVIAIEPKFVFPGRGVVGIENTFAVTDAGGMKLTNIADDIVYL